MLCRAGGGCRQCFARVARGACAGAPAPSSRLDVEVREVFEEQVEPEEGHCRQANTWWAGCASGERFVGGAIGILGTNSTAAVFGGGGSQARRAALSPRGYGRTGAATSPEAATGASTPSLKEICCRCRALRPRWAPAKGGTSTGCKQA